MTKADWLILAGVLLVDAGLFIIYKPLALMFPGIVCIKMALAAGRSMKSGAGE